MSIQARRDVWAVLVGEYGERPWCPLSDIRDVHPQWYSGLVQLAEWGWFLELDKAKKNMRVRKVYPSAEGTRRSMAVIRIVRAIPKPGSSSDGSLGFHGKEHDHDEEVSEDGLTDEEFARTVGKPVLTAQTMVASQKLNEELKKDDSYDEEPVFDSPDEIAELIDIDDESGIISVRDSAVELEVSLEESAFVPESSIRKEYTLTVGSLVLDGSFVTSTNGILARKGSGKSYTAMVVAEEMLKQNLPFAVLDPTGAWWGLRSGADGNPKKGYPIIIAGGIHADLDVFAGDGAAVANWLVSRYPAQLLCDLSLMTPEQQHRFAFAFAAVLFHNNRRAIHLFVDEADEFMPQRPQSKLENSCLAAFDRLVRRGRIKGIGLTAITQRSAVLSKNVLSQVGALVTLQTAAELDLKAIQGWVEKVLDGKDAASFLASLSGLKQGHAWYVCPGRKPLAERITVRKRRTYDSSRTPVIGEEVKDPDLLSVDASDLTSWLSSRRTADEENPGEEDYGQN